MAIALHQIRPVAHLPLVLGVVRQLNVAARIDTCCPPHPAHVLSCGRGVEALLPVVLARFPPVMRVQFAMDNTTRLQVHGIQDDHLLVCAAVGIDQAWYQGVAMEQNSLPRTTPP